MPDDGLSIEIVGSGAEIRPVDGLPSIRDADLTLRVTGRKAVINLGRGGVEMSPGRKFAISNGVFEVPDTFPKAPPAKARFRLDGPVPAAAELLSLERLRDFSGSPLDPATSRGTLAAQVSLGLPLKDDLPPGSSIYTINMDVANFSAERLVMGQKVEASSLQVVANNQGYWIKGDVKLNGVPVALDYRKPRGDGDAEVRIQSTLDEAARAKLGFDLGRLCERAGAGQGQRPGHRIRGRRKPVRDRRRPDPVADRQSAAGLDQAVRQIRARDLHGGQPAAGDPLRRYRDRRARAPRSRARSSSTRTARCRPRISRPSTSRTATRPCSRPSAVRTARCG